MKRTKDDTARTRAMVLDAAADAFYEHGVSRTSLDHIAKRAGLTRGAIYWHFKDKADLLTALHSDTMLPQECLLLEAMANASDDPLDMIETGGVRFLHDFETDERLQRVHTIVTLGCEFIGESRETISRVIAADEEMHNHLKQILEMAEQKGDLNPEWTSETATRALQCSMSGLLTEWLKSGKAFPLSAVGTMVLKGLFQSFRKSGTA